jgi:tartrate-resistant acid phosphatase type 5
LVAALVVLAILWQGSSWLPIGRQYPRQYPRFLVLGDWGRGGEFNQTVVADAMARRAATLHPDFVISTGDNFYDSGLTSVDDPAFDYSFTRVYWQQELQVPWHAVLGNHDYGEDRDGSEPDAPPDACSKKASKAGTCFLSPLHQLDVGLAARDARWHCERSYQLTLAGGEVDLFFIDTTPWVSKYSEEIWAGNRGGLLEQSPEGQLRELEVRLARSSAPWKLVVGHHPIRSNHRAAGVFPEMRDLLEPLLERYSVAAYFNGHDHNLQHIAPTSVGYVQVTSGAGSKTAGDDWFGTQDSPFQWGYNGFVAVTMGKDSMRLEYLGVDSEQPLFAVDVPRRGGV